MNRAIFCSILLLAGCSQKSVQTAPSGPTTQSSQIHAIEDVDARDPFESVNRKVFAFNCLMNRTVFLPFIGFYRWLPPVIKNRVISVVNTIESPISIINCLLQGKIHDCLAHTARLVFNTIFGLGGLFDVATAMKITPQKQNFSKTLKKIGVPSGPYWVVPLFGPSTLRASIGELLDCALMPVTYIEPAAIPYGATAYVMTQAKIMDLVHDFKDTFSDPYSAVRDVYLIARGDSDQVHQDPSTDDESQNSGDVDLLGEDSPSSDEFPPDLLAEEDEPSSATTSPAANANQEPDLLAEDDEPSSATTSPAANANQEPDLLAEDDEPSSATAKPYSKSIKN